MARRGRAGQQGSTVGGVLPAPRPWSAGVGECPVHSRTRRRGGLGAAGPSEVRNGSPPAPRARSGRRCRPASAVRRPPRRRLGAGVGPPYGWSSGPDAAGRVAIVGVGLPRLGAVGPVASPGPAGASAAKTASRRPVRAPTVSRRTISAHLAAEPLTAPAGGLVSRCTVSRCGDARRPGVGRRPAGRGATARRRPGAARARRTRTRRRGGGAAARRRPARGVRVRSRPGVQPSARSTAAPEIRPPRVPAAISTARRSPSRWSSSAPTARRTASGSGSAAGSAPSTSDATYAAACPGRPPTSGSSRSTGATGWPARVSRWRSSRPDCTVASGPIVTGRGRAGPRVGPLRLVHGEHRQRQPARRRRGEQRVQEAAQRRRGPVQVVHGHDQRPAGGQPQQDLPADRRAGERRRPSRPGRPASAAAPGPPSPPGSAGTAASGRRRAGRGPPPGRRRGGSRRGRGAGRATGAST